MFSIINQRNMKKIIIALALIGLCNSDAQAQTTGPAAKAPCKCASAAMKGHTHRHGDTYQVCREMGGHYQCCTHYKTVKKVVAK
jgi:hypothetical protein